GEEAMMRVRAWSALAAAAAVLVVAKLAWTQSSTAKSAPASQEQFPGSEELVARFGLTEKSGGYTDPATGEHKTIKVYVSPRDQADMVFVPGGESVVGAGYSEIYDDPSVMMSARSHRQPEDFFNREQPRHTVILSPFFVDRCEVTNAR